MGDVLFSHEPVIPDKNDEVEATSVSFINESMDQRVSSNIDILDFESLQVVREPNEILARGYNGAAKRAKTKSKSPSKRF